MFENVTLTSVLKDHYSVIHSEKLSENNIIIDEEMVVSNSSEMYLIELAKFLNECYYKGYVLSSSIVSRLMDIIDYTDYQYQVLCSYMDILNNSMNEYLPKMDCKPDFDKLALTTTNCINFVTKYSEAIKDIPEDATVIDNSIIPHFKEPNVEEPKFELRILKEVEDPVQYMMHNTIESEENSLHKLVETFYIIYKMQPEEFLNSIYGFKSEALFFLLNEEDFNIIDICINNIKSFTELSKYIKAYTIYTDKQELPETMVKNIKRIIDILTINITEHQLAKIVSDDYDFWKMVNEYIQHSKISDAINIYDKNPNKYLMYNPIQCIYLLKDLYKDDVFFLARYFVLNMDYRLFCNHFVEIFTELYNQLTIDECYQIISETINGLVLIENIAVDHELVKLADELDNELRKVREDVSIEPIFSYTRDAIYSYKELLRSRNS